MTIPINIKIIKRSNEQLYWVTTFGSVEIRVENLCKFHNFVRNFNCQKWKLFEKKTECKLGLKKLYPNFANEFFKAF